jgi:GNAT superfamily N-acetyltransferase
MATIRPAGASDATLLLGLVSMFPTPTPPTVQSFSQTLALKLADPSACLLVAEHDGILVGYVTGYCHATFYANESTAWVDELFVSESARGRGTGRQLMEAFEQWAQSRGNVLVSLATAGVAAFYEHRGYASKAGYFKKYLVG